MSRLTGIVLTGLATVTVLVNFFVVIHLCSATRQDVRGLEQELNTLTMSWLKSINCSCCKCGKDCSTKCGGVCKCCKCDSCPGNCGTKKDDTGK